MTGRALAAIALRIWGVVFFVGALVSSPQTVFFVRLAPARPQDAWLRAQQIGLMLNLGARALIGLALIVLADRIAAVVIPETEPLAIDADVFDLAVLGFAVAGIFILVWGLQDVASIVYTLVAKPGWPPGVSWSSYLWEQQRIAIVRVIVEIAAGIVLIFGRDAIVSSWWQLRGRARGSEEKDVQ
jgi:hypothetical protein